MSQEKKIWKIANGWCEDFNTYEEAVIAAKRASANDREDVLVFEAVAVVKCPVPELEVVKL